MCWLQGRTALMMAVLENHTEVVQILLNAGADVDSKNDDVSVCWGSVLMVLA